MTRQTAIAHALVKSLYDDGRLDEHQVAAFAEDGKFDEANAAARGARQCLGRDRREHDDRNPRRGRDDPRQGRGHVMVDASSAIIAMRDKLSGGAQTDMRGCKDTYEALRPSTAQQVLRFHRMQQGAAPAA